MLNLYNSSSVNGGPSPVKILVPGFSLSVGPSPAIPQGPVAKPP